MVSVSGEGSSRSPPLGPSSWATGSQGRPFRIDTATMRIHSWLSLIFGESHGYLSIRSALPIAMTCEEPRIGPASAPTIGSRPHRGVQYIPERPDSPNVRESPTAVARFGCHQRSGRQFAVGRRWRLIIQDATLGQTPRQLPALEQPERGERHHADKLDPEHDVRRNTDKFRARGRGQTSRRSAAELG